MNETIEERRVQMNVSNWRVASEQVPVIAVQNDNETCRLIFVGDTSRDLHWDLLLRSEKEELNIISLEPMEDGVGVLLTRDMVCVSGNYHAQLRGTQGTKVRHTNQFTLIVLESFSGDKNWPVIPTEFTQMEERVQQAVEEAETSEKNAADSAELARQAAAQAGYMGFEVDENGNLIYQRTENVSVDFKLEGGNLLLL